MNALSRLPLLLEHKHLLLIRLLCEVVAARILPLIPMLLSIENSLKKNNGYGARNTNDECQTMTYLDNFDELLPVRIRFRQKIVAFLDAFVDPS